jgi:hypothetical protein
MKNESGIRASLSENNTKDFLILCQAKNKGFPRTSSVTGKTQPRAGKREATASPRPLMPKAEESFSS